VQESNLQLQLQIYNVFLKYISITSEMKTGLIFAARKLEKGGWSVPRAPVIQFHFPKSCEMVNTPKPCFDTPHYTCTGT
jgi:hypothetical protein